MPETLTLTIDVASMTLAQRLAGPHHEYLDKLEKLLNIRVLDNSTVFKLTGEAEAVKMGQHAFHALIEIAQRRDLDPMDLNSVIDHLKGRESGAKTQQGISEIATRRKTVGAKTVTQSKYIEAMNTKPLVFGVGPAGTGKTYLAVAHAVRAFEEGKAERLILTRPAVEAGERLGFLPGDMKEKIDPFLRPIYDALFDLMGGEKVEKAMVAGAIEIAPLAFMRGRTLSNAVVLVDEAQNTTSMQMKMVLTRLGQGSQMIVTGDPSQVDLPPMVTSGLTDALKILANLDEVSITTFTSKDVVRHALVAKIIDAYDKAKK